MIGKNAAHTEKKGEPRREKGKKQVDSKFFTVSMRKRVRGARTYDVLVGVHVHPKAILFAFAQCADCVVHEVIVIDATGSQIRNRTIRI